VEALVFLVPHAPVWFNLMGFWLLAMEFLAVGACINMQIWFWIVLLPAAQNRENGESDKFE
jgi:hypothetical protein